MAAQTDFVASSIQRKFESLPESLSTYCIYKVSECIRKISRDSYKPSIISIGPIYYKQKFLKQSQDLKLIYLKCFLQKCDGDQALNLSRYIDVIKDLEGKARSYYEENIDLPSNEFVEMMMVDAAFIIYYIMIYSCNFHDPMETRIATTLEVQRDLFLNDNQLPFFVLNQLFDIAFVPRHGSNMSFKDLVCYFISCTNVPGKEAAETIGRERVREASEIKHLVDFWRICCAPPDRSWNQKSLKNNEVKICCLPTKSSMNKSLKNNELFPLPPSAKELEAAGVKFIAGDSKNFLDIRYSEGVLKIPTLIIHEHTEAFLRSIIHFDQCHYIFDSCFVDYAFFLDALIDTPKDVQILVQHGIIQHILGSDEVVASIMNRITKNMAINTSNFYYSDISRKLNAYAAIRWNKWKVILKRDYFSHPWSTISVAYLVVLLILTVLQVYTGFRA